MENRGEKKLLAATILQQWYDVAAYAIAKAVGAKDGSYQVLQAYLRESISYEDLVENYDKVLQLELPTIVFYNPDLLNLFLEVDESVCDLDAALTDELIVTNYPSLSIPYEVARLRMLALLAHKINPQLTDMIRGSFLENLYKALISEDMQVPAKLKLLVPREVREEIDRENLRQREDHAPINETSSTVRNQMITAGINERMADRIIDTRVERALDGISETRRTKIEQIHKLLKEFDDPRTFIDRLIFPLPEIND